MATTIRPYTDDDLKAQAREDAALGRTLEEGVAHIAHDPKRRAVYEKAYHAAEQTEAA